MDMLAKNQPHLYIVTDSWAIANGQAICLANSRSNNSLAKVSPLGKKLGLSCLKHISPNRNQAYTCVYIKSQYTASSHFLFPLIFYISI